MMEANINTGFLRDFFQEEDKKLSLRRQSLLQMKNHQLQKQQDQEATVAVETYGNALFSFCLYRRRLRDFHVKQLWKCRIYKLQRYVFEVSKTIMRKDELSLM